MFYDGYIINIQYQNNDIRSLVDQVKVIHMKSLRNFPKDIALGVPSNHDKS